jgi:DNA recombination protein RmuC
MILNLTMFFAGFLFGALVFYLMLRREKTLSSEALLSREKSEEALKKLLAENGRLEATLAKEKESFAEKEAILEKSEANLSQAFTALAAEALHKNSKIFLQEAIANLETLQARTKGVLDEKEKAIVGLVNPLKESLEKINNEIKALEGKRIEAYTGLLGQISNVREGQDKLDTTTGELLRALKSPKARGNWGEMQLRRVVEMADMLRFVDFEEQVQITADRDTPDMVIKLPGGRKIIVDAKASMDAFLKALEAPNEEEKKARLLEHSGNVRARLKELSRKEYWDKLGESPEFVVMFLPGESYFAAVLEQDMQFLDDAVRSKVIPASPLTLIALLKAVAYGWKQEETEKSAAILIGYAKELYERLCVAAGHFKEMENSIHKTVETYNKLVGSLESRVMSQGRQIASLSSKELPELNQIYEIPRSLQAPDWKPDGDKE